MEANKKEKEVTKNNVINSEKNKAAELIAIAIGIIVILTCGCFTYVSLTETKPTDIEEKEEETKEEEKKSVILNESNNIEDFSKEWEKCTAFDTCEFKYTKVGNNNLTIILKKSVDTKKVDENDHENAFSYSLTVNDKEVWSSNEFPAEGDISNLQVLKGAYIVLNHYLTGFSSSGKIQVFNFNGEEIYVLDTNEGISELKISDDVIEYVKITSEASKKCYQKYVVKFDENKSNEEKTGTESCEEN